MLPAGGGQNLGTAYGKVILDASQVGTAVRDLTTQLEFAVNGIRVKVQQAGSEFTSIGAAMETLVAPFRGFAREGLAAASSFEDALVEIQARTGATAEQMTLVQNKALEMGAATKFSSQEAAGAFLQLLTAGLSVNEAMEAIEPTMMAAAASGEGLAVTADKVTNVMSAFGLEAADTTAIIDAMARAAGASPATMGQMGEALQSVGGIAAAFGLDVERTSAIMAIFAQNGIRGSEAGTQLRSMLRMMTADTDPAKKAWADLGVSLFDANGNMRDLDIVFKEVAASMAKMPMEQQTRIAQDLAGSYGLVGFNALLSSDGIAAMEAQMQGQSDAATIANARMETFSGWMEQLKGSIETLMISAFTPLMKDVLTPFLKLMTGAVNVITEWVTAHPELTKVILSFLGVLSILAPTLITLGIAISSIGTLLPFLSVGFAALTGPIALVVGAIVALKIAFDKNFLGIRDIVTGVFDRIQNAITIFQTMTGRGIDRLTALSTAIRAVFPQPIADRIILALRAVMNVVDNIREAIGKFQLGIASFRIALEQGMTPLNAFRIAVQNVVDDILIALGVSEETARAIRDQLVAAIQSLPDVLESVGRQFNAVMNIIRLAFDALQSAVESGNTNFELLRAVMSRIVGERAASLIAGALHLIAEAIIAIRDGISGAIDFVQNFFGLLQAGFSPIAALNTAIRNAFGEDTAARLISFEATMSRVFGNIADSAGVIGSKLGTVFGGIRDSIQLAVTGDFEGGMFGGVPEDHPIVHFWVRVHEILKSTFTNIKDAMAGVFTGDFKLPTLEGGLDLSAIKETIQSNMASITSEPVDFSNFSQWLSDNLNTAITVGLGIFGAIVGGPVGLVISVGKIIADALGIDIGGAIKQFLDETGISESIGSAISDIFNGLDLSNIDLSGLETITKPIKDFFDGLFTIDETGVSGIERVFNAIGSFINPVIDALKGAISENILPGLQNLIDGIGGFFEALSDTDTAGIENVAAAFGAVISAIASAVVEIAGIVAGGVLDAIGAALPGIGTAISGIIEAVAALGRGDISGIIDGLGKALRGLWDAFTGLAGGLADTVINILEKIFNIDIADVSTGLAAFKSGFENAILAIQILWDRMTRGITLGIAELKVEILKVVAAAEAALGGVSESTQSALTEATKEVYSLKSADEFERVLREQLENKKFDLTAPVTIDVAGVQHSEALSEKLYGELTPEALSLTGKRLLEKSIALAAEQADVSSLQGFMQAALTAGMDVDFGSILQAAVERQDWTAAANIVLSARQVEADIDFNAILQQALDTGNMELAANMLILAEQSNVTIQGDILEKTKQALEESPGQLGIIHTAVNVAAETFPQISREELLTKAKNLLTVQDGTAGIVNVLVKAATEVLPTVNIQGFLDKIRGAISGLSTFANVLANVNLTPQTAPAAPSSFMAGATPIRLPTVHIGGAGRDLGGPGLKGMAYSIGTGAQPEGFIAPSNGQFIPNLDRVLAGLGGGDTISVEVNNPAAGTDGFGLGMDIARGIEAERRRKGMTR